MDQNLIFHTFVFPSRYVREKFWPEDEANIGGALGSPRIEPGFTFDIVHRTHKHY